MSDYLEHGVDHKLGSDAQLCQLGRRLHRAQALQHEQRVLDLAVWESVLQRAARIHGRKGSSTPMRFAVTPLARMIWAAVAIASTLPWPEVRSSGTQGGAISRWWVSSRWPP